MTNQVGNPWDSDWSHSQLYNARANVTDQSQQNQLANAEHRAFAREVVSDNPLMAVPLLAAIPAYQGAKALGLTNSRSEPSVDQAAEAYKGVGEGLAKPWEQVWNNVKETVVEPIKQVVDAVTPPWLTDWATPPKPSYVNEAAPQTAKATKFASVFSKLVNTESGGKHTDAQGNLTTSAKGAQGITQVLPKVGADPGFGVQPLQNKSQEEYIRFGRDYLQAMLKEFNGDYEQALAAYNHGVGNVKRAITKNGDAWKDKLPAETRNYITKILGNK